MPSIGRDFPRKVRPTAFSNCRRARKDSNIAPGGQGFCIPSGAATYHRARFILMAPSQWNWKCTASEECEMTLSGKYKCTSAEKRIPLPPPKRTGCPDPRGRGCPASAPITQESRGRLPSSPGLSAITRQRPTLPPGGAVPSARAGLTSLFGMGRGGSPRL